MPDGSLTDRQLGDIATEVLFENDRVRIWSMILEPGQATPVHQHDLDYVQVQLAGDRIAGAPEPDNEGRYTEYREHDVTPGQFWFMPRGGVEVAKNVGKETYKGLLIELKD
jgi:beta-alanine degradation protein BauB